MQPRSWRSRRFSHGWWCGIFNTNRDLLLVGVVVAILVAVTLVMDTGSSPVESSFPVYVQLVPVDDTSGNVTWGVNLSEDALNFGRLPAGSIESERSITVSNDEAGPVTVSLAKEGNISGFIFFSSRDITLQPGEQRNVTVTFRTAEDVEPGIYSGQINVKSFSSPP